MSKTDKVRSKVGLLYGGMALVMALMVMVLCNAFVLAVSAAGKGTVTADSANVRKEASTSSDKVGSVKKGDTVTINSEVQGADGYTWYQIVVSTDQTGYIRSDLVQKTEDTGNPPVTVNPTVEVTKVQPTGATITGGDIVRVRPDASTSGSVITTVSNGTAITVTGQATGADGFTWYLVSFTANNAQVEGFVRSDFVKLSGELVPEGTTTPEPTEPTPSTPQEPTTTPEQPSEEKKPYEVVLEDDGKWYLFDYTTADATKMGDEWEIASLLDSYAKRGEELNAAKKSVRNQKIAIIILVIIIVAVVLIATMLYFKVKDVTDDAYFQAVEKETIRERRAMKEQAGRDPREPGRKVMQTVGAERPNAAKPGEVYPPGKNQAKSNAQGVPARNAAAAQGRPAGAGSQVRPANAGSQVRSNSQTGVQGRTVQNGSQARPAGQATMQNRPAQSGMGTRPAGSVKSPNAGAVQPTGQKPMGQKPMSQPVASAKPGMQQTKAVNSPVSDDDDEFEFEFLNWDGDEK